MSISTLFKSPTKIIESKPLLSILLQIQRGKMKKEVLNLRKLFSNDQSHSFDIQKRAIPFFSVCGHFVSKDQRVSMANYSGYQILEITYLSEKHKVKVRKQIAQDPFCFCCFETATGLGLHIIVPTRARKEQHAAVFNAVKKYYELVLGIKRFSSQGEDLDYLCLFSYDKNAYINLEAKSF